MRTKRFAWIGLTAVWGLTFASGALAAADGTPGEETTGLVEVVIRSTHQFRDPQAAKDAGYGPGNVCVSGPEEGAMGEHYINGQSLFDGQLDPEKPEALIYEVRGGKARLVGVEYIVIAKDWHTNNGPGTPTVLGQLMNYVGSPNRYGLDPFYELHVWAWKLNPNGMFVDWNPKVSCAEFKPEPAPEAAVHGHSHGAHGARSAATGSPASPGVGR